MNKIISMSVFGNDKRYITGAKRQAELAQEFFPDWTVKIYVDQINNFKDLDSKIILEEVNDETYGVFWRFLPLFENEKNIVIVRDSDGRITLREKMAVEEWLESEKTFHTFRDHEAHYEFPVIACAFGYKGKLPKVLKESMNHYAQQFFYTSDQIWLRDFVWPYVENNSIVHSMNEIDSWFSKSRNNLINKYDFCGNGFDENDMPLYAETLDACKNFIPETVDVKYKFNKGQMSE